MIMGLLSRSDGWERTRAHDDQDNDDWATRSMRSMVQQFYDKSTHKFLCIF